MTGIEREKIYLQIFCYTHVRLAPLQRKLLKCFVIATYICIFQHGHRWWHDKYPDSVLDIYPRVLRHVVCYRIRSVPYTGL